MRLLTGPEKAKWTWEAMGLQAYPRSGDDLWTLIYFTSLFLFWSHCEACRFLVPWPGIEPVPLQWKLGVPLTGPSGKSPDHHF